MKLTEFRNGRSQEYIINNEHDFAAFLRNYDETLMFSHNMYDAISLINRHFGWKLNDDGGFIETDKYYISIDGNKMIEKVNTYFYTRKNVFLITRNPDGSLEFFPKNRDAGNLIKQHGGIDNFLQHCKVDARPYDQVLAEFKQKLADAEAERKRVAAENKRKESEIIKSEYDALLKDGGEIEVTPQNLRVIMRYLRTINWGMWHLPKLSQGYSAFQYDCGGVKDVVTIKLDSGILIDGKCVKKFKCGVHDKYLKDYINIERV